MRAYLDTQVVVRLAQGDLKKITRTAQKAIERYDLFVSPMVHLELQYLFETGRITASAETIFTHLDSTIGLSHCLIPFAEIARAACHETWTRDAFDRIIVAQARHAANAPLLTTDEHIQAHYDKAVW